MDNFLTTWLLDDIIINLINLKFLFYVFISTSIPSLPRSHPMDGSRNK